MAKVLAKPSWRQLQKATIESCEHECARWHRADPNRTNGPSVAIDRFSNQRTNTDEVVWNIYPENDLEILPHAPWGPDARKHLETLACVRSILCFLFAAKIHRAPNKNMQPKPWKMSLGEGA